MWQFCYKKKRKKEKNFVVLHEFFFSHFRGPFWYRSVSISFHLLSWVNLAHTHTYQKTKTENFLLHYYWVVFCCFFCLASWVLLHCPLLQMMQFFGLLRLMPFLKFTKFHPSGNYVYCLWQVPSSTCTHYHIQSIYDSLYGLPNPRMTHCTDYRRYALALQHPVHIRLTGRTA